MINPAYLPFILAGGVIIFLVIFFHYVPFFLWLSAKVSGVKISLIQLFLMRIRNVPPYVMVYLLQILLVTLMLSQHLQSLMQTETHSICSQSYS